MNLKDTISQVDSSISAVIEKNIADEAMARAGYYELLKLISDEGDAKVIEEIISDELNHSERLKGLSLKYNGVASATS